MKGRNEKLQMNQFPVLNGLIKKLLMKGLRRNDVLLENSCWNCAGFK